LGGSLVVAAGTCFLWYFAYTLHQSPRDHELAYTFTLKRNFTNPFTATLLPLLVVAGLLFTLVAITGRSREQMAASG
jgi:hypothetical protein